MAPRPPSKPRSPLNLVVLALLFEAPMHPYRMQKLIRERGQDKLVNVKSRNSVQQTVTRLERDGLIRAADSQHDGHYPQRTVYALTPTGREELLTSLYQLLAEPAEEYPLFPAALAFLALTTPPTAARLLRDRRDRLATTVDDLRRSTTVAATTLPEVLLIENDYALALQEAEIAWLDRTLAALESGSLTWDTQALIDLPTSAARTDPDDGRYDGRNGDRYDEAADEAADGDSGGGSGGDGGSGGRGAGGGNRPG